MEKKVLSVITIIMVILILLIIPNKVNAQSTTKISVTSNKMQLKKGEEFKVRVNLSDITLDGGISVVQAKISYNSNFIEAIKENDTTYNEWTRTWNTQNGQVSIDKAEKVTQEQEIASFTFKVKEDTTLKEDTILFSDIVVCNEEKEESCEDVSIKVTLIEEENKDNEQNGENQEQDKEQGGNDQEQDKEQGGEDQEQDKEQGGNDQEQGKEQGGNDKEKDKEQSNNKVKENISNNKVIPNLGAEEWSIGIIIAITIFGIISYLGYKKYRSI